MTQPALSALSQDTARDFATLRTAGFGAIMFGHENDRTHAFKAFPASAAIMAIFIGRLHGEIRLPSVSTHGLDPMSAVAMPAATGPHFACKIFTGAHASDMGPRTAEAGKTMRYRDSLGRRGLEAVKSAHPGTPVPAGPWARHKALADDLASADECVVSSWLNVDGMAWNRADPDRAAGFMQLARLARGGRDL